MRCPDCNKFVAYAEPPEAEEQSLTIDDGTLEAAVRLVLCCEECGRELKEATFELERDLKEYVCVEGEEHELDTSFDHLESSERSEGKGRIRTTYYGIESVIKVGCSCGKVVSVQWDTDEKASNMDELV